MIRFLKIVNCVVFLSSLHLSLSRGPTSSPGAAVPGCPGGRLYDLATPLFVRRSAAGSRCPSAAPPPRPPRAPPLPLLPPARGSRSAGTTTAASERPDPNRDLHRDLRTTAAAWRRQTVTTRQKHASEEEEGEEEEEEKEEEEEEERVG